MWIDFCESELLKENAWIYFCECEQTIKWENIASKCYLYILNQHVFEDVKLSGWLSLISFLDILSRFSAAFYVEQRKKKI